MRLLHYRRLNRACRRGVDCRLKGKALMLWRIMTTEAVERDAKRQDVKRACEFVHLELNEGDEATFVMA